MHIWSAWLPASELQGSPYLHLASSGNIVINYHAQLFYMAGMVKIKSSCLPTKCFMG